MIKHVFFWNTVEFSAGWENGPLSRNFWHNLVNNLRVFFFGVEYSFKRRLSPREPSVCFAGVRESELNDSLILLLF